MFNSGCEKGFEVLAGVLRLQTTPEVLGVRAGNVEIHRLTILNDAADFIDHIRASRPCLVANLWHQRQIVGRSLFTRLGHHSASVSLRLAAYHSFAFAGFGLILWLRPAWRHDHGTVAQHSEDRSLY